MTIFFIILGLVVFSKPLGWLFGGLMISEHNASRTAAKVAEQQRIHELNTIDWTKKLPWQK